METPNSLPTHEHIPGLELGRQFYSERVKPLLAAEFATMRYSAALIGPGSEILGYDTTQSTDHDWGARLLLFISEVDYQTHADRLNALWAQTLPTTFHGHPVKGVQINTIQRYFIAYLGFDPGADITPTNWLTCSEQRLLSVTAGQVYHDGLGDLAAIRSKLAYYPDDVWLYLLAAQWDRIDQEEPFVGRTGDAGDELGSRLIAARLIRDLMKLSFLMERHYAPYIKWFGTAFSALESASELMPIFDAVWSAMDWQAREHELSRAVELAAQRHNALGITPPLPTLVTRFHDRPYLVIHADKFAMAIRAAIKNPELKPELLIGGIDQFIDSTRILSRSDLAQLAAVYVPSLDT